jgi:hypothetical protein
MRAYHWFFIIGTILLTFTLTNSIFYTSIVLLVISIIGAILHYDENKKDLNKDSCNINR